MWRAERMLPPAVPMPLEALFNWERRLRCPIRGRSQIGQLGSKHNRRFSSYKMVNLLTRSKFLVARAALAELEGANDIWTQTAQQALDSVRNQRSAVQPSDGNPPM